MTQSARVTNPGASEAVPETCPIPASAAAKGSDGKTFRGQSRGSALLAAALDRAARAEIAVYTLLVEAKDGPAAAFYEA